MNANILLSLPVMVSLIGAVVLVITFCLERREENKKVLTGRFYITVFSACVLFVVGIKQQIENKEKDIEAKAFKDSLFKFNDSLYKLNQRLDSK